MKEIRFQQVKTNMKTKQNVLLKKSELCVEQLNFHEIEFEFVL